MTRALKFNKRYFFLILFFLFSCSPAERKTKIPENIIPQEQMVGVLVDFHLAEGALAVAEQNGKDVTPLTNKYYNFILKKHGITKGKFDASLKFYSSNLKDFSKIYQDVVSELSKTQSRIISKPPGI